MMQGLDGAHFQVARTTSHPEIAALTEMKPSLSSFAMSPSKFRSQPALNEEAAFPI